MNIFKSHIRHNIHQAKETDTALSSVDIQNNTCKKILTVSDKQNSIALLDFLPSPNLK